MSLALSILFFTYSICSLHYTQYFTRSKASGLSAYLNGNAANQLNGEEFEFESEELEESEEEWGEQLSADANKWVLLSPSRFCSKEEWRFTDVCSFLLCARATYTKRWRRMFAGRAVAEGVVEVSAFVLSSSLKVELFVDVEENRLLVVVCCVITLPIERSPLYLRTRKSIFLIGVL